YLGPLRHRDQPGCLACLLARVSGSPYGPDLDADGNLALCESLQNPIISLYILAALSELTAAEVKAHVSGQATRTSGGAFVFDDVKGKVTFEALVPRSLCTVCGPP